MAGRATTKYIDVVCAPNVPHFGACGVYDYYGYRMPKVILGKPVGGERVHANQNQLEHHTEFYKRRVPASAKRSITWFVAGHLKAGSGQACNEYNGYSQSTTNYGSCHAWRLVKSSKAKVGTGRRLAVKKKWDRKYLFLKVVYHYRINGKRHMFTLWSEHHKIRS